MTCPASSRTVYAGAARLNMAASLSRILIVEDGGVPSVAPLVGLLSVRLKVTWPPTFFGSRIGMLNDWEVTPEAKKSVFCTAV